MTPVFKKPDQADTWVETEYQNVALEECNRHWMSSILAGYNASGDGVALYLVCFVSE